MLGTLSVLQAESNVVVTFSRDKDDFYCHDQPGFLVLLVSEVRKKGHTP